MRLRSRLARTIRLPEVSGNAVAISDHHMVRAADGAAIARSRGSDEMEIPALASLRQRWRTFESGGDRDLEIRHRAHGLRWIWSDRDRRAHWELPFAKPADPS